MKAKKIIVFCFTLFLAFCLVGCGNAKTSTAVGNNLNKTVDNLSGVIQKLEEVNYNDIVINDINPLKDNTFNTVSSKYTQKSKWYTVGAIGEDKPKYNAKYVNSDQVDNNKIDLTDNTDCENGDCYNVPSTSSYKPKYVNKVSNSFVRTSLDGYIQNIESLYNECADCISCEAECKNAKNILTQNIKDCKTLCQKLKDGTIDLSQTEIDTCNDYLKILQSLTNRLGTTKGNVKTKVNSIVKVKNNYNTQIDSVKEAYQKLLEALETRLECYNECNNTIYSIQDVINKTNVNIKEAEKNKSESKDINKNWTEKVEDVNKKQSITNKTNIINSKNPNYEQQKNNIFGNTNNQNSLSSNQNTMNNTTPNSNKNLQNSQNKTSDLNNQTQNNQITNQGLTNKQSNFGTQNNNQNQNLSNNNFQVQNSQPPYEEPIIEQPKVNNNQPQTNTTNQSPVANNQPPVLNNQNPQRPVVNNGYPQNNGIGYNNYPNGVNNGYPPRNIDTYQNINKNIDTYRPNTPIYNGTYTNQNIVNNNQQPINNNQNLNTNSNLTQTKFKNINKDLKTDDINDSVDKSINNINLKASQHTNNKAHIKDILDKQFIEYQKSITDENSPLPYPYDNKKIAEQNKKASENQDIKTLNIENENNNTNNENIDENYGIMTLEEPIIDSTMQSVKNIENTDKNTTNTTTMHTQKTKDIKDNQNNQTNNQKTDTKDIKNPVNNNNNSENEEHIARKQVHKEYTKNSN